MKMESSLLDTQLDMFGGVLFGKKLLTGFWEVRQLGFVVNPYLEPRVGGSGFAFQL
jgi:hypothetical protein